MEHKKAFRIAIAQLPISSNARKNGGSIKNAMHKAANDGARLVHFAEGMLTGYPKEQITSWDEVDWPAVHDELAAIMQLAAELHIWVVLGSAHQLTPPHWPHNSLYIISDEGKLVTRYDKRRLSYTEVTKFYTAGYEPIVFEVDGYRFGCAICVEIVFSELFIAYRKLGVDCMLFSAYPVDARFDIKARAYADIHSFWVSLATPAQTAGFIKSALIGPNGHVVNQLEGKQGIMFAELNPHDPQLHVALYKAQPWRASVATDQRYQTRQLNDPESINRTLF